MAEVAQGAVAPAVTDVPAPEGATVVADPAPPPEGETPPVTTEPTFKQKDMDRVVAKERRRFEKEMEVRISERVRLEVAERELRAKTESTQPKGEPQPGDFTDAKEYVKALVRHEREQERATEKQQSETQREQQGQAEQGRRMVEAVMKSAEALGVDDFEQVAFNPDLPVTPAMAVAIEESEVAAKVLYHLGQNPAEAARIAKLRTTHQVREIAKLEAKLTAAPATTKAPPPITPTSSTATVEQRLEDADYDTFVKIRRKQNAAKNGRS